MRDRMAAAQHMILAPTHLDIRGRVMLGLDAGPRSSEPAAPTERRRPGTDRAIEAVLP